MTNRLSIGSDSNPLIVQLTEYEGTRLVDIRRYYKDRKTNELLPTKKGVSLSRRYFTCLRDFFKEASGSIDDWLAGGAISVADQVGAAMATRQTAADQAAHEARPFEVHSMDGGRGCFFSVTAQGNHYDVRLNESHPFVKSLHKTTLESAGGCHAKSSNAHARELVATLLVSFRRATELFDGDSEMNADRLLRALEYEWALILANYTDSQRQP